MRSALPSSILKSLAEFVDASLRDLLIERGDFDSETTEEIATIFRRRIDMATDEVEDLTVEQRLEKALREDGISEDLVRDAVGMRDYALAYGALAHLSGIALDKIEAVFDSRSAKSVVAITWKAGLSMRLALQLQQEAARVSHKDLIYPRGGTDYPMDDTALIQQLEILNV